MTKKYLLFTNKLHSILFQHNRRDVIRTTGLKLSYCGRVGGAFTWSSRIELATKVWPQEIGFFLCVWARESVCVQGLKERADWSSPRQINYAPRQAWLVGVDMIFWRKPGKSLAWKIIEISRSDIWYYRVSSGTLICICIIH